MAVASNQDLYARKAVNITTATTTSIPCTTLHRVMVGTGVASATAIVRYADDDTVIATIDCATPAIGFEFLLDVGTRGIEVVTNSTANITVTYT